jgi:hypothetical protein
LTALDRQWKYALHNNCIRISIVYHNMISIEQGEFNKSCLFE